MPQTAAAPSVAAALVEVPVTRILVGVDFQPASLRAVAIARKLASAFGASLTLVHAVRDPTAAMADGEPEDRARLAHVEARSLLDELAHACGARVGAVVEYGDPAGVLMEEADSSEADLIVVGTHSHTGLQRFVLGSVAARIVRDPPCPVLTVPLTEGAPEADEEESL